MSPPKDRLSITEIDARASKDSVPAPPPPKPRLPLRSRPELDDEPDTGVTSARALANRLEERVRDGNELRCENEQLRREVERLRAAPKAVEIEGPEIQLRARAGGSKWLTALLAGLLGAGGAVGATEGAKAVKETAEPAPTRAQLENVVADLKALQERVDAQRKWLADADEDQQQWQRLELAFMCAERRVLAEGVSCDQVLSSVQVAPDPLASKAPPQLVIRGAKLPLRRLPPTK